MEAVVDDRKIRKVIRQTIEDCQEREITATMIADIAYQKLEREGHDLSDILRSRLTATAAVVLKEMFEPDEDAETLLKKADALEGWAKRRGLI